MKLKMSKWCVLVFALSLAAATPLFAQNGPGGGGGQGGPGGDPNGGPGGGGPGGPGGGPPNPAERRQHELQDIQDEMNVTDDKWKELEPKFEKLMEMHDDLSPHGGGPPRPDQQDNNKDESPLRKSLNDLRDTLDDKDAKPEDIKARIDAYEKLRVQTQDDMKKAEDDLKATLGPVDQAILIVHGVLE